MNKEINNLTEGLNPAQKEAVEQFEGPSLIIAGAGSGKTKVLTSRIANILNHGHKASTILALTFTNKASKEMKERIANIVGAERARWLWMGTFHSVFIRFLREDAHLLGLPSGFTIYDTSDSKSVIRTIVKELNLDEKKYKPGLVLSRISMAKNNLYTASAYQKNQELVQNDIYSKVPQIGQIFAIYEKKCKQSGALDFDDILLYTNILLRDHPEVLEKLRNRFKYILVDEYQDTNYAQYLIIKKISSQHRNLCVVGDDAQSIYAFRGARIENILNFRKDYPEAKEFRLEQNYRSTQIVVDAANSLIEKNSKQLKKRCFSASEEGEKIEVIKAYTDQEEAFLVASSIQSKIYTTRQPYSEFAVLYRTNAQSRAIEESLRKKGIPYRIYGGNSFYDRAEVKDILAYLRLLINPKDDEAFKRVVNNPARKIGATSIEYLSSAANAANISLWEAVNGGELVNLESHGLKGKALERLQEFCKMILSVAHKVDESNAYDVAMEIFVVSGYAAMLAGDNSIEGQSRSENVEELMNSVKSFVEEMEAESELQETEEQVRPSSSLRDFLENISLMSQLDNQEEEQDNNKVNLMTVHSAKGLEFCHVYIIGLEENLFPSVNSSATESEIEEERRLMYVAITRAKKSVTISYAQTRFRWGSHVSYPPSRFLREISREYLNWSAYESEAPLITKSTKTESIGLRKPEIKRVNTPPKAPDPNFVADPISKLREGQRIEHDRFGFGKIISIEGDPVNLKAIVEFDQGGQKILLLKFAKLRIV